MMQLIENDEFKSVKASHKGIHALQYLASGMEDFPEEDLTLNKILCGIPFEDPIPFVSELSMEEKEKTDSLVKAMTLHWPKMKNTSIDGFRASFFHRNGTLCKKEGNWHLKVEEKSYDILIDYITWSFKILKLPWMDCAVFTEWR